MVAIIPTKIGMPTLRTEIYEEAYTKALAKDLDVIDKLRESAAMCMASYQQRTTNLYNRRVRHHAYQVRDLVLRRVFENTAYPIARKFQKNWEGPYMIVRLGPTGSYALEKLDGGPVPKMWNATHLKRYYQ